VLKQIFYCCLTASLLFMCACPLRGEEPKKEEKKDAVLKPLEPYGGFTLKLEEGEKIWTDREDVFLSVPESLRGKGYILSPMLYSEAVVEKPGYVYVITPTPVKAHLAPRFSKSAAGRVIPYFAPNLVALGFERMEEIEEFRISAKLKEPVAVFAKYAEKGEVIKYGKPSWGVTVAGLSPDYKDNEVKVPEIEKGRSNVIKTPATLHIKAGKEYAFSERTYQGVPGVEITPGGRLWVSWVADKTGVYTEGPRNFTVLVTSDDNGKTWSDPPVIAVQHPVWPIACVDPMVWHDPSGRLWYAWTQRDVPLDRYDSWRITTEDSENENPAWSKPEIVGTGTLLNKPAVLSTGEWLFCSSFRGSPVDVYVSTDRGKTITHLSKADVPRAGWNEHMIIERKDGSLWMLVRRYGGIAQSFSYDRGKTWTEGELYRPGPSTRFHIRRLKSGRLLLIAHPVEEGARMRTNITAYLSEDEGKTWPYGLLLDDREWVSYPDAVETKDGVIYSVHDHHRPSKMEIVMSVFTEEDIMAGKLVSENSRLGVIISGRDRK